MKNILKTALFLIAPALIMSGCIKEVFPEDGTVTTAQVSAASLESRILGLHAWMNNFNSVGNENHFDFGYPAIILSRELLGQDMVMEEAYYQFHAWYYVENQSETTLWTALPYYWAYKLIRMCNNIIREYKDKTDILDEEKELLGIAYFYRAFAYFDIARMYIQGRYIDNQDGPTAPIVTEETSDEDTADNPRARASDMYTLILDDLEIAETNLAAYSRDTYALPDLSVVQGLLARVYLEMGDYPKAQQYAAAAYADYYPLSESEWRDRVKGFNTPTDAWMWCCTTTSNDDVVQTGIINWTAHMSMEALYGYAAAGNRISIDAHLYSLVPQSDFRRNSWANITDGIADSELPISFWRDYNSVKFRPGNGSFYSNTVGSAVSVPLMRAEEMMLIEAEAAGRQNLAAGKQLLEDFVKTYRDDTYVSTSATEEEFIDEVWLQRRIELWGEGFAILDLKRLNKPVIRNYDGTNHTDLYRFNTDMIGSTGSPQWLNLVIPRAERRGNEAVTQTNNNPDPSMTPGNTEPPHVW